MFASLNFVFCISYFYQLTIIYQHLGELGRPISTSLESLGKDIKATAEKNKRMQDIERSVNNSQSSLIEKENKTDDVHLNASYNSSLLSRVHRAQEAIKNENSSVYINPLPNAKSTPSSNQRNERKIFGTPEITKGFKFKTPNSGAATPLENRTAGYRSGSYHGTKNGSSNRQPSVPSYQRETAASTLKKSPTKVRNTIKLLFA